MSRFMASVGDSVDGDPEHELIAEARRFLASTSIEEQHVIRNQFKLQTRKNFEIPTLDPPPPARRLFYIEVDPEPHPRFDLRFKRMSALQLAWETFMKLCALRPSGLVTDFLTSAKFPLASFKPMEMHVFPKAAGTLYGFIADAYPDASAPDLSAKLTWNPLCTLCHHQRNLFIYELVFKGIRYLPRPTLKRLLDLLRIGRESIENILERVPFCTIFLTGRLHVLRKLVHSSLDEILDCISQAYYTCEACSHVKKWYANRRAHRSVVALDQIDRFPLCRDLLELVRSAALPPQTSMDECKSVVRAINSRNARCSYSTGHGTDYESHAQMDQEETEMRMEEWSRSFTHQHYKTHEGLADFFTPLDLDLVMDLVSRKRKRSPPQPAQTALGRA